MRASPLTYASLVLTAFFWGSAFNVGAHVIAGMSPISAGTERFLIASVALLALLACTGRLDWRLARRHLPALAAVGVLGVAGFNLAMFFGLRSTTPFNAALLMATTPLWTLLLSALIEREPIDRWRADHAALASEPFALDALILYESHLGRDRASYEPVARWPLG